jgi:CTP:molybdopterin cytidylyltransferase MocA
VIAVITAGGRVDAAFAATLGTDVKALARIGGRAMLDVAIEAARGTGAERVLVVGGDEVRAHCADRVDGVLDDAGEGRENVRRAMIAGNADHLLLLTSDMPFIDAAALNAFVSAAQGCDVALPVSSGADYEAAYPGAPPHVTDLGGERIANGNVVYFAPGSAQRVLPVAQRLFDARKSLWRMASLLGPALLVRFALRRLRIEDIERRAREELGIDARACRNLAPSLCFDVDGDEDYRYAQRRAGNG